MALNAKTDKPTKLSELTKGFMKDYIAYNGNDDDKAWYIALVSNNLITKKNNFTGKEYETIDIKIVRKEFCVRFFPNLIKKDKTTKKSYLDELKEDFAK